jgi:chromatin remodeling complex protein RSC6
MRRSLVMLASVPLLVAAAACGSDDGANGEIVADDSITEAVTPDETEDESTESETDTDTESETETETDAETGDAGASSTSGGTATLTLDNGEVFEFDGVLCSLEPQMAAGSEILFTATSYGDPGLDITQFGTEGTITDLASISVYDGEYNSLWDANSMFGTPVELSLDGTTITGTGSFIPEEDVSQPAVEGTVVANC